MTGAGVPVVAPRVIVALMTLSSAIVRAADISVKADKHMAEFDGKTWDDYEQRLFAHLDARGLLDVHVQSGPWLTDGNLQRDARGEGPLPKFVSGGTTVPCHGL